ncbi:MAG TPA: hypothetical protein VGG48_06680 [Rhizomicrobium sp.]|jgi:hypothetical protein
MLSRFLFLLVALAIPATDALAAPQQIIILRHGEKKDKYALCSIGEERSLALADVYLGKHGSFFADKLAPAAFYTITLHTIELASPSTQTFGLPQISFSAVPIKDSPDGDSTELLNTRTRDAAKDIFGNPAYNAGTVVMIWEHKHIADAKLEKQYPGQVVTLRQALGLADLAAKRPDLKIPDTWEGENYDYFWVVSYGYGSNTPIDFKMIRQTYGGIYAKLPQNDWGKPDHIRHKHGCE